MVFCSLRVFRIRYYGKAATVVCRLMIGGFAFCAVLGTAGGVRAQTLQTFLANGTFSYGNETFTISNCTIGGNGCSSTDSANIDIIGYTNGRGGTGIELAPISNDHSYIYSSSKASGAQNAALTFTMMVTDKAGSRGLSSITNILTATDSNGTDSRNLVTSTLNTFTGVTHPANSSIVSNLTTGTTSNTFDLTQSPSTNPLGFNVSIAYNSAAAAGTLTLTNIKLLLNPAPEPMSIMLLGTGLMGLASVRKRIKRRS